MALDGNTGEVLWKHDSVQDVFGVNCNVDIDRDGVKDCLAAGRMGVSVMNSHTIWRRGRGSLDSRPYGCL